jgi:hypothetical protein
MAELLYGSSNWSQIYPVKKLSQKKYIASFPACAKASVQL